MKLYKIKTVCIANRAKNLTKRKYQHITDPIRYVWGTQVTIVVHDWSLYILGYTANSRLTWELLGTKLCLKTKETKISYSYNSTAKKLNLFFKWMNDLKCYLSRNRYTHTHSTIPSHENANQHHNEMPSHAN